MIAHSDDEAFRGAGHCLDRAAELLRYAGRVDLADRCLVLSDLVSDAARKRKREKSSG